MFRASSQLTHGEIATVLQLRTVPASQYQIVARDGDDGAKAANAAEIEEEDMKHGTWQDLVDGKDSGGGCCLIV